MEEKRFMDTLWAPVLLQGFRVPGTRPKTKLTVTACWRMIALCFTTSHTNLSSVISEVRKDTSSNIYHPE